MKFDIEGLKKFDCASAIKGQMVILANYFYYEGKWVFSELEVKSVSAKKGMITLNDPLAPKFNKDGKDIGKALYSRNEAILLEHNPENLKVIRAYQQHQHLVRKTTKLLEKLVADGSQELKNMSVERLQELYEFVNQNFAPKDV